MKRNGFAFLDVIVGIFIIGLIIVTILPTLGLTQKFFTNHKRTSHMIYLSELTIEKLIVKDDNSVLFLKELEVNKESVYPYLDDKEYTSTVKLLGENSYIWNLLVTVKESKGGEAGVELKATITK